MRLFIVMRIYAKNTVIGDLLVKKKGIVTLNIGSFNTAY